MTTLYDLGYELAEKVERIQDLLNDGANPENEEIQLMLEQMVAQEDEWKEKSKRVSRFIHQMMLEEKMIDAEAKRLADKAKRTKQTYGYLHDLLLNQMLEFGLNEIEDPVLSVKVRENPWSVVIKDETQIPEEFKKEKTTIEVDKRGLLNKRESLGDIQGIQFIRTKKLAFK
ncbi:siphovirus Gp157 family protein [Acinetobacter gerneri]|uniref:siphovirus Gp157 family protein n=1 Tax=Acinetobacter gerneri TaxID=202952 RepID=UPI0028B0B01E|nr:siphovirus Gp157 family protein [Acinetobacter gerneri]